MERKLTAEEKGALRGLKDWNRDNDLNSNPPRRIPYVPCKHSDLIPLLDSLVAKGYARKEKDGYFAGKNAQKTMA